MPTLLDTPVPGQPDVTAGRHHVKVLSRAQREFNAKIAYLFEFSIVAGPCRGKIVRGIASATLHPLSKLRRWSEVLMQQPLPVGVKFDVDKLNGKDAVAIVVHKQGRERTFANVADLEPLPAPNLHGLEVTDADLPEGL